MTSLLEFFSETMDELKFQLEVDEVRWGETWRHRPREGQEARAFARFKDYWDQFENAGTPIPWLKVMGEAHICLVRDRHPELMLTDR